MKELFIRCKQLHAPCNACGTKLELRAQKITLFLLKHPIIHVKLAYACTGALFIVHDSAICVQGNVDKCMCHSPLYT